MFGLHNKYIDTLYRTAAHLHSYTVRSAELHAQVVPVFWEGSHSSLPSRAKWACYESGASFCCIISMQARCKNKSMTNRLRCWPCRPNLWPPPMKKQDTVLRFRLLASRFSFQLMWVWAGIMLLGLGTIHYKQINGEKVKCEGTLKHFIFCFW